MGSEPPTSGRFWVLVAVIAIVVACVLAGVVGYDAIRRRLGPSQATAPAETWTKPWHPSVDFICAPKHKLYLATVDLEKRNAQLEERSPKVAPFTCP